MGRITVFTADDANSLFVLKALEKRNLPYSLVSVAAEPDRSKDTKALCGRSGLPLAFFNTRCVGSVNDTLSELVRWDISSSYPSPLDKYEEEIKSMEDPANPKLQPSTKDAQSEEQAAAESFVLDPIDLPDGTKISHHDLAEKLKNSLKPSEMKVKGVVYKKAFRGSDAVAIFQQSMALSQEDVVQFANKLLDVGIMHSVPLKANQKTAFSGDAVYRLQSDATPHLINTYRLWKQDISIKTEDVLSSLDDLLRKIEMDSASDIGLLDCGQAMAHAEFPRFEEIVCCLQSVDFLSLDGKEKLPFALNLYNIMLRYAFIKVGIPVFDADRLDFLENVGFKLGEHSFTFREWIDGVVRGNVKSFASSKIPFPKGDARRDYALDMFDPIVHYALNAGPHVGMRTSVPFHLYNAQDIDQQLRIAAVVFFEDEANFEVSDGAAKIPVTLGQYKQDFSAGSTSQMMEKVSEYLSVSQRNQLDGLGEKPKVAFAEANWAKNYSKFARYDKEAIVAERKGIKALISRLQKPRMPENEKLRLATVRSLNMLDSLPEERFDRITLMAQTTFASPLVCITFVEDTDYYVKSAKTVFDVDLHKRFSRDTSFCGHVLLENEMMIVPDTQQDNRFADNPVANAMGFRFYAGANITVPAAGGNGETVNVGTLCVFDNKPRHFSTKEKGMLTDFAKEISGECLRRDSLS